jgi:acyl-CoA synthetase (AMP-forming)/AMP-acid ligase II
LSTSYETLLDSGRRRAFAARKVDPDSVKLLLYTSGTTGTPKAVLHSHNTIGRLVENTAQHWNLTAGEALLMPSPITHLTGYGTGLELPFMIGTRTLLMEHWDAREAARLIDRHGIVGTVSATPFLMELTDAAQSLGTRLPSLRFFGCGGAAVPPEVIRNANATFLQPCSFRLFGCTEAPAITLGWLGAAHLEHAATTDGEIVDYEVRVVATDGAPLPAGTEGEILARGPAMFLGYADEAQTRESLTDDGFYRTGDIGVVTPDRAIIVTGRKKDIIIRGGENISAKEIEDVLHRHPAIAEAAVVSMPHARLGEGVCAFIVLHPGETADPRTLANFVADCGLALQKCPEHVEIVATLPRTATGKIRKDILREEIRAKKRMAAQ